MSKLITSPLFRALICFLLICCLAINISPIRTKAFLVETATVSAVGLTLYLYLLWSGFVVPPPDIGVYQQVDDSFRDYLEDLGIDESSWASDADDLDDEWEASDSSDSSESEATTVNVGQTLRNLFKIFIAGSLVKASIDLFPDIEAPSTGWTYYGDTLLPTLASYSDCPYVILYTDGTYYYFHSSSAPLYLKPSNGYLYANSSVSYYYDYATYSKIDNWDTNSSYIHDELKTVSSGKIVSYFCDNILWANYDVLSYTDGSVLHAADSEPISSENKYLVPSAIMGSIAGGIQAGTLTEDDINLPPILDVSSVFTGGMANYHEDMVQAAQDLIDGKISHEEFQEQLAYSEDTGTDVPSASTPVENPDDSGEEETTPSTDTEWQPPSDPGQFALDLTNVFPFCIPFDLYDFLTCLNADPVAPVIQWELALPGGGSFPIELDLSPFDSVAQLLRRLQLLLFCVGLAIKTRDLIKG